MWQWRHGCEPETQVAMRRLPPAGPCLLRLRLFRSISATIAVLFLAAAPRLLRASASSGDVCPRPSSGSVVGEPADLRSKDGVLRVDLTARNVREADGRIRYCFVDGEGRESPNLRVRPGDLVILHLKNGMSDLDGDASGAMHMHAEHAAADECAGGAMGPMSMGPISTNLHFHGLTIPPVCHQDDVLHTTVEPGDAPFTYRFRIPQDEPPGLYWYHPHIHGFSKQQVLGGASGALIVEGIERARSELAGMPERVFVIRDEDLANPNAPPSKFEPVVPKFMADHDGDSVNNGMGFGKPAKDLSINYVPVPYPDYPPAIIEMKPGERQLWRVLDRKSVV